ncbi:MAG: T9SS type A sorting domain-containing protein [Bacteroidia bacterium]|nr:T9SS type A sorting domain-containing protein [Bacteroidia bacterium]
MKNLLFTISLFLLTASVALAQGNLRFSYTVTNNGPTTVVDVFVQNITATPENMTSFTMNAYYDNTESSLTNYDVSPTNALGWFSLPSSTAFTAATNPKIPITYTGFGNVNVLDFFANGSSFGQTSVKVLTINFDNTPGTAAGSSIFLTSFSDGHDAQVYNNDVAPIPDAYPVIMIQPVSFPVEWLSFEAKPLGRSQTQLSWVTGSETDNTGFFVERRAAPTSPQDWETLGFVAGSGTTTRESSYEFVDSAPFSGENLYRLRQIDINGGQDLSEIRSVYFDADFSMVLYPNPADTYATLEMEIGEAGTVRLELLDMRGRKVQESTHELTPGKNLLGIEAENLPEGVYTLRVQGSYHSADLRLVIQ